MKRLLGLLALTAALLLVWTPGRTAWAQTAGPIEREWTVDGVKRTALLYVPVDAATVKAPVIFAFHGHGGTARQASRSLNFQKYWPEAIVVFMQGLDTPGQLTDPTGTRPGWQKAAGDQNDRDLKFFDAVLASLKTDYKVDESRVFASGHSNGGGFTYLLWAARGDVFRAVAPSSAVPSPGARNPKPKPVLHVAGQTDPLVKFAWQQRVIDNDRSIDGTGSDGKVWAMSGPITGTEYVGKSGVPVVTLIHAGGHVFPAEAPELIVRFFKEVSGER